jgi:ferredoxin-like protein FixX
MKCIHCSDTGSLSKALDGYLDCAHCDVAAERAKLEAWAFDLITKHGATAAMWLVYQHGRTELTTPA